MATLYVAEFSRTAEGGNGSPMQVGKAPPVQEQTVSIGGSSTQSGVFLGGTKMIRIHADAICSIAIGIDPTATASKMRMAAGQTEYFGVEPGWKIAAITNS